MVKDFKVINGFAQTIMEDILLFLENIHNIRNFLVISNKSKKTGMV